MRISDWISDMCSSDLRHGRRRSCITALHSQHGGAGHAGDSSCRSQESHRFWPTPCLPHGQYPPCPHIVRGGAIRVTRSEEHTSERQSLMRISYAVFCLKKKNISKNNKHDTKKHNKKKN